MDNHKRATLKLAGTAFACGVARWATAQPASAPATGPDGGGLDPYPGGYRVKAPPVPAGEPDIVRVREGELQGVRAGDIRYFRGVPFAKPPVGDLRFLPPQVGAPWSGVRQATENPPAAMQVTQLVEAPTSEDCLYLNIWAPAAPGPHPVYVYIHGGGNTSGYSLEHRVQGATFARDGVVCVNIGYRLGSLGFLELGGLLGDAFEGSGNNGLRDQLRALQWIQDNIAAFGGDPSKVTIGGQSAGGFNVCSLTASPLSRGLFRAGISQSGSGHGVITRSLAREHAERFAEALARQGDKPEQLPTLPVDRILSVERASTRTGDNNGFIDGQLLLEHPYEAMRKGRGKQVALLMGSNRDEMRLFSAAPDPSSFTGRNGAAFARYRAMNPGIGVSELAGRFASDLAFGGPTMVYADNHAKAGGVSYVYRWDWGPATGRFKGLAIHGVETPFVWDNAAALAFRYVEPDPTLQARAAVAHELWVDFIRSGRPAAQGVPSWPRWTPRDRAFMDIGEQYRIEQASSRSVALWDELLGA